MESIATKYIDSIAYSVGYDIHNEEDKRHLREIIIAGLQDMKDSGVSEEVLKTNALVLTTLIIFVTDNMNMSSGQFITSSMYVTNVAKLRYRS